MKSKTIYLDYAASTAIDWRIIKEMARVSRVYGNPSSVHSQGRAARAILDSSRQRIGNILGTKGESLIFTGSGTEACNLAIIGTAQANRKHGKHIVLTNIEHHAVLNSCKHLKKKEGFELSVVPVEKNGIVNPQNIVSAIRKDTILVAVICANNEIGTIQPVAQISKLMRQKFGSARPSLYTDAIAAAPHLNLNVQELGVDLMSINGSKIYGPKGIGCLYVRKKDILEPIIFGGDQEYGLRAGTPSPELAAGLALSLELVTKTRKSVSEKIEKLRDYAIKKIIGTIPDVILNGDRYDRLPGNINFSFKDVDGEMLMLRLDRRGICVSTGSACTVSSNEPSHVIQALGLPLQYTRGTIRATLGKSTTRRDIDIFADALLKEITTSSFLRDNKLRLKKN